MISIDHEIKKDGELWVAGPQVVTLLFKYKGGVIKIWNYHPINNIKDDINWERTHHIPIFQ